MGRFTKNVLAALLAEGGGLVDRSKYPEFEVGLDGARRRGLLQSVLPGVYAPPELAADPMVRIRAVASWDPDAILTGAAAANLSFWPELRVSIVQVSTRRSGVNAVGFEMSRRRIPDALVIHDGDLRLTCPALTALDLCTERHGDGIDEVLRRRAARLDDVREALALTSHRPGAAYMRRLVHDSRDEPWSAAERRLHRLLHAGRVTGWQANVRVGDALATYFIDVAFRSQRLALEVDGRAHADDRRLFESDRVRQNWLVLHGWRVLRFTWRMLVDEPDRVINQIRLGLRAADLPRRPPRRLMAGAG